MIDAKAAVQSAYNYLLDMIRVEAPDRDPKDIMLEEVEPSPEQDSWLVTFSYSIPAESNAASDSPMSPSIRNFLRQFPRRRLRVVEINREDGAFLSLKAPG